MTTSNAPLVRSLSPVPQCELDAYENCGQLQLRWGRSGDKKGQYMSLDVMQVNPRRPVNHGTKYIAAFKTQLPSIRRLTRRRQ